MRELDPEERERLWQHGLHEDTLFNERQNAFVGFQSILLALAGALVLAEPKSATIFVRAIGVAGMLTSLFSAYFQKRQADYVEFLAGRCRQHLPEFKETFELRRAAAPRRVSSKQLYSLLLPGLFIVVWLILLAI